jgi:hypothetical protein
LSPFRTIRLIGVEPALQNVPNLLSVIQKKVRLFQLVAIINMKSRSVLAQLQPNCAGWSGSLRSMSGLNLGLSALLKVADRVHFLVGDADESVVCIICFPDYQRSAFSSCMTESIEKLSSNSPFLAWLAEPYLPLEISFLINTSQCSPKLGLVVAIIHLNYSHLLKMNIV